MPPRARNEEKTDVTTKDNDGGPDAQLQHPTSEVTQFENEYVLLLHGGFTVSNFETPKRANEYGVATYGDNVWWSILPVLKRKLPKEEDDD